MVELAKLFLISDVVNKVKAPSQLVTTPIKNKSDKKPKSIKNSE